MRENTEDDRGREPKLKGNSGFVVSVGEFRGRLLVVYGWISLGKDRASDFRIVDSLILPLTKILFFFSPSQSYNQPANPTGPLTKH